MKAILARVSTEEQAKKGYSLDDQLRSCQSKAGTTEVKEYIDDGYSGEYLERPALTQLRKDVKEGLITEIICLDPDRLARNLMNQLIITDEFDKRGVNLVFVSAEYAKTPEGRLFYSMRGAISEFEKAKINERMSRGRREKARQGRVLRDFQIYGYGYNKTTAQIEVNSQEAAVVKLMFDLCTKPEGRVRGFNGIAHYLTNTGIPTKRGAAVWHRQVVKQILMNRAYIGEFYQNKWNTEGMLGNKYKTSDDKIPMSLRPKDEWILIPCPPILERSQFEKAQQILIESKRRWTKSTRNQYLLSGLIRCGDCGNTMCGMKSTNWGTPVLIYTCSKSTAGAKNKGCGKRPNCKSIDEEVWNTVKNWLDQPDEIAASQVEPQSSSFEDSEKERILKEIEKAKIARKRLLKLYASDDFEESEIKQELREWKNKEDKLLSQLEEIESRLEDTQSQGYNQQILQEAVTYYMERTEELSFEDRRSLIRHVVKEVRVFKDYIDIYRF